MSIYHYFPEQGASPRRALRPGRGRPAAGRSVAALARAAEALGSRLPSDGAPLSALLPVHRAPPPQHPGRPGVAGAHPPHAPRWRARHRDDRAVLSRDRLLHHRWNAGRDVGLRPGPYGRRASAGGGSRPRLPRGRRGQPILQAAQSTKRPSCSVSTHCSTAWQQRPPLGRKPTDGAAAPPGESRSAGVRSASRRATSSRSSSR